jgi:peroxiredoxin
VRVWGIASADGEETVRTYAEQLGLTFPVLMDPGGVVADQYQQQSPFPSAAYPQDWIVDDEGVIVYVNNAFDLAAMEAALERALAD